MIFPWVPYDASVTEMVAVTIIAYTVTHHFNGCPSYSNHISSTLSLLMAL